MVGRSATVYDVRLHLLRCKDIQGRQRASRTSMALPTGPLPPCPPLRTCHGIGAEHRGQGALHVVLQGEDIPAKVTLQALASWQAHVHAAQQLSVLAGGGGGAQRRVQVALQAGKAGAGGQARGGRMRGGSQLATREKGRRAESKCPAGGQADAGRRGQMLRAAGRNAPAGTQGGCCCQACPL